MQSVDSELQQQLAARVRYFRDLGIFDFYRRGEAVQEHAATFGDPATTTSEELALIQLRSETFPAMPRAAVASPLISFTPSEKPVPPKMRGAALEAIRAEIGDCQRCPLAATRNKIVFGDGNPHAQLMFVGEGPGADEDAQGLPFVGRGGQLLNSMIDAMGLKREEVYIANIVKCRPPKNRVPEPLEANTCKPFLFQQIDVIRPELIVALGSTAATYLLGVKSSLSSLRGRLHQAFNTKLVVTYHPAFLLRDPSQKREAWRDLQIAMRELGLKARRAD